MLKLRINDGRQEPLWVVEKTFTIGSDDDNHLIIDDASVSPHHAKLSGMGRTYVLKDLSRDESTFVNEQAIEQQAVACLDVLKFGDVTVNIVDPAEEANEYEWALIACANSVNGQEFPLHFGQDSNLTEDNSPTKNNSLTIGRGKACDIAFPGTHLAKQHARLTLQDDGLLIEELEVATGVFVNDKRVTSVVANAGDKIRLDVYNFRLFGPGIGLAKAEVKPAVEIPKPASDGIKESDKARLKNKEWITRPTSPGNRDEAEHAKKASPLIIFFSLVMIAVLVGLSVYAFV